jgi:hypothetical protein
LAIKLERKFGKGKNIIQRKEGIIEKCKNKNERRENSLNEGMPECDL